MFTIKYNSGTVHIDGLNIRTEGSEFDYAKSACPALSRSYRFVERGAKATTAAGVLEEARKLAVAVGGKKLCKHCAAAAEAQAEAEAAAETKTAPRQLRAAQGETVVGSGWELLYDKPRQGCQVGRRDGQYALICVEHLTVHRLSRLTDERAARSAGGWCPDCKH
jgi:hypothetical protein